MVVRGSVGNGFFGGVGSPLAMKGGPWVEEGSLNSGGRRS